LDLFGDVRVGAQGGEGDAGRHFDCSWTSGGGGFASWLRNCKMPGLDRSCVRDWVFGSGEEVDGSRRGKEAGIYGGHEEAEGLRGPSLNSKPCLPRLDGKTDVVRFFGDSARGPGRTLAGPFSPGAGQLQIGDPLRHGGCWGRPVPLSWVAQSHSVPEHWVGLSGPLPYQIWKQRARPGEQSGLRITPSTLNQRHALGYPS
jgi:hypothetical protein